MPQEFLSDHLTAPILQLPDGAVATSTQVASRAQAVQLFLCQKRDASPQKMCVVFFTAWHYLFRSGHLFVRNRHYF